MVSKEWSEHCEFMNRSCDALVLAYNPNQILGISCDRGFYIPGNNGVEEAFGFALRKIFGVKDGSCHWADAIRWANIKNLNKLEKRILQGVSTVTGGDHEYQTTFDGYLSSFGGFESTWIYLKGDLYRFNDGKRKEALNAFEKYWNSAEKQRWTEIHEHMRDYTKKEFKEKEQR